MSGTGANPYGELNDEATKKTYLDNVESPDLFLPVLVAKRNFVSDRKGIRDNLGNISVAPYRRLPSIFPKIGRPQSQLTTLQDRLGLPF